MSKMCVCVCGIDGEKSRYIYGLHGCAVERLLWLGNGTVERGVQVMSYGYQFQVIWELCYSLLAYTNESCRSDSEILC
jgi:hypothetical protein